MKRVKNGTPSVQPLYGDEIRALRKIQRDYPACPYVFESNRHSPLAKDTISGIVEEAGKLARLPFPIHTHMLRLTHRLPRTQIEVLIREQFRATLVIATSSIPCVTQN